MSRDDFDLSDFGEMDEPAFSEDDAEFLPPDTALSGGRPPRNTTFMIVAVILVIVFILGIVGIAAIVLSNAEKAKQNDATAAAIIATNNYLFTAAAATATAKSWTLTPSPTPIPTDTPTPTSSPTPIPTDSPTPSLTPIIEPGATGTSGTLVVIAGSGTPVGTETLTPSPSVTVLSDQSAVLTQSALGTQFAGTNIAATCNASPIGCDGAVTATSAVGGVFRPDQLTGTFIAQLTANAKGVKVPTALPKGGIFEDIAGGKASPDSLAIVGLGAIALVGVIVVSRRMRIK